MKRRIGVDIGSTEVRIAEVAGIDSKGAAIVTRFSSSPLREGAVVGGKIKDPSAVALGLNRAFKDAGLSKRGFIIGLSTTDSSIVQRALPASIKKEEREGAIRNSGENITTSIPLEEASLATQSINTEIRDGLAVTTLAVASCSRSEIEMISNVCKLAGAQPRAVDLSGAALMRSMVRISPNNNETATIVDIGASKITIATRKGAHVRFLRTLANGGNEITRSIMGVTEEDFEQAEMRKLNMNLPAVRHQSFTAAYDFGAEEEQSVEVLKAKALSNAFEKAATGLVDNIAFSVEADADMSGDYTQGVIICGGTARLKGLKERLQQRLGVETIVGAPLIRIERSRQNALHFIEGKENPVVVMNAAVATGLALWKEPA